MKSGFLTLTLVCLAACANTPKTSQTTRPPERLNVYDFGAKGDGVADDTLAFQSAIDAASDAGGGIVFAPRGNYLIKTGLTIRPYVTLEGVFTAPSARSANKGTTLLAVAGKGSENGPAFITLQGTSATLKGITLFYPEQIQTNDQEPVPYPWCIQSRGGDNHTLLDLLLVNPYKGIEMVGAGRHFVSRVYGQPFKVGLYVDQIYDVGRIENVHFWPFGIPYDEKSKFYQWQLNNGISFIFGRTDWQYVLNTFCFGYHTGYKFIRTEKGVCNGNFHGIGADYTQVAVDVEDSWEIGVLITNGEFVGIVDPEAVGLRVGPKNKGVLQLSNCAFWGPQRNVARIEGEGAVTFTGCNFMWQWDKHGKGEPAILCDGGQLTVNGCFFNYDGKDVIVGEKTQEAILTSNRAKDGFQVENQIGEKCQMGFNSLGK